MCHWRSGNRVCTSSIYYEGSALLHCKSKYFQTQFYIDTLNSCSNFGPTACKHSVYIRTNMCTEFCAGIYFVFFLLKCNLYFLVCFSREFCLIPWNDCIPLTVTYFFFVTRICCVFHLVARLCSSQCRLRGSQTSCEFWHNTTVTPIHISTVQCFSHELHTRFMCVG